MSKKIFCLLKTCAVISNSLFYIVELVTFSPAVNAQCQSNMASMKQILRSYQWKNYKNFDWNGLFTCLKIYFAWWKLALWSRRLLIQRWTFDFSAGSQRSILVKHGFNQSTHHYTHIHGKIINILTETGRSYAPKNFYLIITCALISHSFIHSAELNCDIFARSQHSMPVKHGFNETNIALISVEKWNIF